MIRESRIFARAAIGSLVLTCLALASCSAGGDTTTCLPGDSWTTKITIRGGASGGRYNSLIENIAERAQSLRAAASDASDCEPGSPGCRPKPKTCPLLSKFDISLENGGSKSNLIDLGMQEVADADTYGFVSRRWQRAKSFAFRLRINPVCAIARSGDSCAVDRSGQLGAKYALVQNYFIYAAATKACRDGSLKGCNLADPENDLLNGYRHFEELRIVLPLYHGPVQFVTTDKTTKADGGRTIESLLDLKSERVYLGAAESVNRVHGKEVLDRHPSLAHDIQILPRNEALFELFVKTHAGKYDAATFETVKQALAEDDYYAFSAPFSKNREGWAAQAREKHPELSRRIDELADEVEDFLGPSLGQRLFERFVETYAPGYVGADFDTLRQLLQADNFVVFEPPFTDTRETWLAIASDVDTEMEPAVDGIADDLEEFLGRRPGKTIFELFIESHAEKYGQLELGDTYAEAEIEAIREVLRDGDFYALTPPFKKNRIGWVAAMRESHRQLRQVADDVSRDVTAFLGLGTGQSSLGRRLIACDIAKAFVISGDILDPSEPVPDKDQCGSNGALHKQIPIPEIIIDGMVRQRHYYQKVDAPDVLTGGDEDAAFTMPAVTTYLVTTTAADSSEVRALTTALDSDWQNLMLLNPILAPLEENIYKKPAAYHPGAERAFADKNLMGQTVWWLIVGGCFLLFVLAWKPEAKYDRLGVQDYGWRQELWQLTKDTGKVLAIFFGTLAVFALVLALIRVWETSEATLQNTDDQLSRFAFFQALLWMFTFVSSGYENNVFPSSAWSRFFISVFAIGGIALPLWAIVTVIDRLRERRLNRARGGVYRGFIRRGWDRVGDTLRWGRRSKGMLLVCGWNSKAPGLVYTLTCPDSPFPGVINIVADPDVEYPIKHWGFNRSRVRFYRGDSSQRRTLERAEARKSDYALILADENAGSDSNSVGVLTALALRRLSKDRDTQAFISAEFALREGDREFSSKNVDEIIDPRLLARQTLAIACFEERIVDFVLDVLSPDDHCEWYSISTAELGAQLFPLQEECTVGAYSKALQQNGIGVIGVCHEHRDETGGVFAPDFRNHRHMDPLLSRDSTEQPLPRTSHIICSAEKPKSIQRARSNKLLRNSYKPNFAPDEATILPPMPAHARILIIGNAEQASALAGYLSDAVPGTMCGVVATDEGSHDELASQIETSVGRGYSAGNGEGDSRSDWTHVVILSSMPDSDGAADLARQAMHADTRTVLWTNLVKMTLKANDSDAFVVAEVNNVHSRQMAKDAEADVVVPTNLVTERVMARLMTGRGHVSEMLSAMMNLDDGVFLRSISLDGAHPLVGRRLGDVLNTWFVDGRVLGVLPANPGNVGRLDERYRNHSGDFDTHFAMCPTVDERNRALKEHDLVIVLAYPPSGLQ